MSKAINSHLEFRTKDECTSDHLPLPTVESDNLYEIVVSYYGLPENKGTEKDIDKQIEEYVSKNILNSRENVTRFYKVLIEKLCDKKTTKTPSLATTPAVDTIDADTIESKPVVVDTKSAVVDMKPVVGKKPVSVPFNSKNIRNSKDSKDSKDSRDSKDNKDNKDNKDSKDSKDIKDNKNRSLNPKK